jgi:hypothetical protein
LLGQRFWTSDEIDLNDIKVGIVISEIRLTNGEHLITREHFKLDSIVSKHRIITNPTGTVFEIEDTVAKLMFAAWNNSCDFDTDEPAPSKDMDSEGKYRYVLHKRRERSSALRKEKVKHFLTTNDFINCELCRVNLNDKYCSGQVKLATVLGISQNSCSDLFGVRPPLY